MSAKSIIMMAFFFTMPISKNHADNRDNRQNRCASDTSSQQSAKTPADGIVERIVIGWTKALIEDAEHQDRP